MDSASAGATATPSTLTMDASVDEDTTDEVKVFRTNDADEAIDMASSSAELTADKKDLALEAEIESQTDQPLGQRMITPLRSAFNDVLPSPNFEFLKPFLMGPLSPLHPYAAASYASNPLLAMSNPMCHANAAMQIAAALARHSPSYMSFGTPGFAPGMTPNGSGGPAMSGSLLSFASNGNNGTRFPPGNYPNLNSPLTSMASNLNGMTLSERKNNSSPYRQQHRHHNQSSSSQQNSSQQKTPKRDKAARMTSSEKKDKGHIKKPCNAFMWFMKVNRADLLEKEGGQQKQSALLNQQLGKIWQSMPKKDQQKYYDMAAAEREDHQRRYPQWTARENYAIHKKKKKKREKSMENNETKKCRARFGVDNQSQWCKHCKRKKRCLNVRDTDSPVVSSTTNPTTPLSQHQQASMFSSHLNSPSSSGIMSIGKRSESNTSSDYDPNTPPPSGTNNNNGGDVSTRTQSTMAASTSVFNQNRVSKTEQEEMPDMPKPTPSHHLLHPSLLNAQQLAAQMMSPSLLGQSPFGYFSSLTSPSHFLRH